MIPQMATLDPAFCRLRQERLRALMAQQGLEAFLTTHRHHIHWATGHWHAQPLTCVALLVVREGPTILVLPDEPNSPPLADRVLSYSAQKVCTLIEDIDAAAAAVLAPHLVPFPTAIGVAGAVAPPFLAALSQPPQNVTSAFQMLRRFKDPDEIRALRRCIAATDAVYEEARRLLVPGLTEIALFAALQAAATIAAGEPLSGWGNDFQCGSPGGPPRNRPAGSGEIAVLDIGIGIQGYRSDLCRSIVVGGPPSQAQQEAHSHVVSVLQEVEDRLRPGVSCRELFDHAKSRLDGWEGGAFFHHLGHGIGLDAHEVPRLNPQWNDTLASGDVIAVEPGFYREDLRAGLRLEQNYLITPEGAERLSDFPLDL